ncbi:MAG: hypothetical protein HYW71_01180 [Candidatus Niyogibacteria bacterium]|nr:hypothetical protein [Candidatus Niyogibacteria bacterium]
MAHGYLLIGSIEQARKIAAEAAGRLLENFNQNHPDFFEFCGESFGISEARELIRKTYLKAFGAGNKKIFFIGAETITLEAASALLKTMEDFSDAAHFFLSVLSEENLPVTLCSRLVKIRMAFEPEAGFTDYWRNFEKKPHIDKMEYLKKIADKKDEKEQKKILDAREIYFEDILKNSGNDEQRKKSLENLENLVFARELMDGPAAYPKSILEYLILT